MEWALLQLFLTVSIVLCISGELCVDTSATLVPAYGGKRITDLDSVLWTVTLSMPMCLERCYQDPSCLSVNVAPDTDTCVGFQQKFKGQTPNTEAAQGYRVYEMDKAGPLDCTTDDVCSTNFGPSHCHENLCRCDIGYSLDGFHCRNLAECSSLSSVMSEYPGFINRMSSDKVSNDMTLSSCKTFCLDDILCKTSDFNSKTGRCWLNDITWNELDDVDAGTNDEFIYLQRDCIW